MQNRVMPRWCLGIIGGFLFVAATSGCDPDVQNRSSAGAPESQRKQERAMIATEWDTLWTSGGATRDTLLLNPYLISASQNGVYVFDGGASRLIAFRPDGSVGWTFGRSGAGPDEFGGVRDLKVGADGELFVLDPRNARIVRLDAMGTVRARIPLSAVGHAEQLAAIDRERMVLFTMDQQRAFALVDTTGAVRERFSLPWVAFDALHPIARQGLMVPGRGGEWIFGFSIGDGWFSFDGSAPAGSARYIEHTEFPEIRTTPEGGSRMAEYSACSACSAGVSDSTLYIHFGGYTRHRQSVVDLYSLNDRTYRGSYLLPIKATMISTAGDRIYALRDDPYPMLFALRPRL